ncbi:hypothetical protein AB0A71_29710 [Kitasatospora aureofaciens]|uniref:hypothetical protein n=1 Tax=Kitasatospora aureofaciens TaxID=1894 RepID=UPI0033CFEFE7
MQLTGVPFFLCTVILAPISLSVAMVFWSRVRGPRFVRAIAVIAFCQLTAVLVVFVMVNNSNLIYGSWSDLFGTGKHVRAAPAAPRHRAGMSNPLRPRCKRPSTAWTT